MLFAKSSPLMHKPLFDRWFQGKPWWSWSCWWWSLYILNIIIMTIIIFMQPKHTPDYSDDDYDDSLLLPGEMNILQIQCKIDFNTFLLCKPHSRGTKWLRTLLLVHVGWLLGIPGHHLWFLVLTGNTWWLMMIFGVSFTTLSLKNAIFCVIFCCSKPALRFFWLFWYDMFINEYEC